MTPTPAAETHATDSRALDAPHVWAQVLQNVLGGVGAGVALAALMWLLGANLQAHWQWPLGLAVLAAGLATAWRAWLDEFRAGRRWNEREALHREEIDALCADLDEVEEERDRLLAAYDALRSRNQWLEERLKQPMKINGKPVDFEKNPPYQFAKALINKHYGRGEPVTARHMMSIGWSQGGYTAALDVLKSAGIVEVRGTQTTWADYPSPEAACIALYDSSRVVLNDNTSIQDGEAT